MLKIIYFFECVKILEGKDKNCEIDEKKFLVENGICSIRNEKNCIGKSEVLGNVKVIEKIFKRKIIF